MQNKCACGCKTTGTHECYRCHQTFAQICVNYITTLQKFCCHTCYNRYHNIIFPLTNATWSICCIGKPCVCGCGLLGNNVCSECLGLFSYRCGNWGPKPEHKYWRIICLECYRKKWPNDWMNQQWNNCCTPTVPNIVSVVRLFIL